MSDKVHVYLGAVRLDSNKSLLTRTDTFEQAEAKANDANAYAKEAGLIARYTATAENFEVRL